MTWNVWGRYGQWEERKAAIEDSLVAAGPDIICLVESWSSTETTQAARIAQRLGVEHQLFVGDWDQDDWVSGIGLVSRWPLSIVERRKLRGEDDSGVGEVLAAIVEGERGRIQLFAVMLDYPLDASRLRQDQDRQLAQLISETTRRQLPVLVCGDFNAGPDSDEIRMLTGRSATAVAGLVFYDAWEIAGDGSAGDTWSNRNPLAAVGMFPDRRFDYVLSAWPRLGVVGHPSIASCSVSCLATNATIRPLRRPCRPSLLRRPHSATRGDTIPADGGSCLSEVAPFRGFRRQYGSFSTSGGGSSACRRGQGSDGR